MALDFEKLSPHLRDTLLSLKHMSPMQRFNELSRPRFELNWQTMAFRYGIEKLEKQGWMISDNEILNPASAVNGAATPVQTAQEIGRSGDRVIGSSENQNQDSPQRRQRAQRRGKTEEGEQQESTQDPGLQQVQEQVNAGLERMVEAAAMETKRRCATQTSPVNAGIDPGDERAKSFKFGDGGVEWWGEGVACKAGQSPRSRIDRVIRKADYTRRAQMFSPKSR